MIAKQYILNLSSPLNMIPWITKFGGMTIMAENGNGVKVPVAEEVTVPECFDTNHYKELIPDAEKKGIAYCEEVTPAVITSGVGAANNMRISQTLRLVVWINFPKSGFSTADIKAFYPIHRAILGTRVTSSQFEVYVRTHAVANMKILTHEQAKAVFARYQFESDLSALITWPYGLHVIEFELVGAVDPECLPTTSGGAEIPDC